MRVPIIMASHSRRKWQKYHVSGLLFFKSCKSEIVVIFHKAYVGVLLSVYGCPYTNKEIARSRRCRRYKKGAHGELRPILPKSSISSKQSAMPAIRNVKDAITKFASSSAVEQSGLLLNAFNRDTNSFLSSHIAYKSATSLSDQHTYAKSTSPSKKRAKHPPTRPRNAFFIFRSEYNKACKQSCTNQAVVSKNAAEAWNALSEDAKAEWYELQEEAKKKHAEQYPEYAKRVRGVKKRETSSHECKDVTLSTSVEHRGHSH